jgi:hypothetical protein
LEPTFVSDDATPTIKSPMNSESAIDHVRSLMGTSRAVAGSVGRRALVYDAAGSIDPRRRDVKARQESARRSIAAA